MTPLACLELNALTDIRGTKEQNRISSFPYSPRGREASSLSVLRILFSSSRSPAGSPVRLAARSSSGLPGSSSSTRTWPPPWSIFSDVVPARMHEPGHGLADEQVSGHSGALGVQVRRMRVPGQSQGICAASFAMAATCWRDRIWAKASVASARIAEVSTATSERPVKTQDCEGQCSARENVKIQVLILHEQLSPVRHADTVISHTG